MATGTEGVPQELITQASNDRMLLNNIYQSSRDYHNLADFLAHVFWRVLYGPVLKGNEKIVQTTCKLQLRCCFEVSAHFIICTFVGKKPTP